MHSDTFPHELPTQAPHHHRHYVSLRTYGLALLLALAVLHMAAYAMYRWVERDEIREQLRSFAHILSASGVAPADADLARYDRDIIVLERGTFPDDARAFQQRIGDDDYLIYGEPGSPFVVAKGLSQLDRESVLMAMLLCALYLSEVVVLLGWWLLVKEKVRELYNVT